MSEKIAEYKGWALYFHIDYEDDGRKAWHTALDPHGNSYSVDFSAYSVMMPDEFSLWIDLGRPSRRFFNMIGPMEHRDFSALREIMERFNIPAEATEENITRLRVTMALYAPDNCFWNLTETR